MPDPAVLFDSTAVPAEGSVLGTTPGGRDERVPVDLAVAR